MFEPRRDKPEGRAVVFGAMVHLSGPYWQRRDTKFPSIRTFPRDRFKDGQQRFRIHGAENFTEPYRGFDVEVIGLEFPFRAIISAGPGFTQTIPKDFEERGEKMLSFGACRITHAETGVIADAHHWPTHGLLITFRHLPRNPTGDAIEAARRLLSFFTLDYRGAPKITPDLIMDAFEKLGGDASQTAIARELGVTQRALQMWAKREGKKSWEEMREDYAPRAPMS